MATDLTFVTVCTIAASVFLAGVDAGECSENCPDVYDPLCGRNNVTYMNDCFLRMAMCRERGHISIHHRGTCGCQAAMLAGPCDDDDWTPLCGTDNNDYTNMCQLQLANDCRSDVNISVKHDGFCVPDPEDPLCHSNMACTVVYAPVCGSNGRTFGNTCYLDHFNVCRKDKVTVLFYSACKVIWMGVGITALILLALIICLCICVLRRSRKQSTRYEVHRPEKEDL